MYQALYRKYRPKNFSEVIGQTTIVKTLSNEIVNNKLTHAYLFTGPRGTGKTSVAKIMAKTINCLNLNGSLPCNECVSCTQINNNQSVDIIEIDAASNNGVDEVRELRSKVNLVPSNSKYKIYIIDEVHMMTTGAFNALLKTLEEPPVHVVFILATTDPQKVPVTILSRCQRFDFKKISDLDIYEKIKSICENEQIKINKEALIEISRLSDGGMRDALSILDQTIAYSDDVISINEVHDVNGTVTSKELIPFTKALILGDVEFVFNKIDEYNRTGKNIFKLTEEIIYFLRNILLYKTALTYLKLVNSDFESYGKDFEFVDKETIANLVNDLNKVHNEMRESNNVKLLLEIFIIRNIPTTKDLNEIKIVKKEPINVNKEEISVELTQTTEKPLNKTETLVEFETIKDIRINNALANIDKKAMKELLSSLEDIRTLVINNKYKKIANALIDGNLKAFGNNQIIYSFDDANSVNVINGNLPLTEEIIKKVTDKDYKMIAVDNSEWDQIKKEYNDKTKQYKYIEEKFNIQMFAKKVEIQSDDESDEILKTFGNLVKYK